jgi:hypothetical protein
MPVPSLAKSTAQAGANTPILPPMGNGFGQIIAAVMVCLKIRPISRKRWPLRRFIQKLAN